MDLSKSFESVNKSNSSHSIDAFFDRDDSESTSDITCTGSLDKYFNINKITKNSTKSDLPRSGSSKKMLYNFEDIYVNTSGMQSNMTNCDVVEKIAVSTTDKKPDKKPNRHKKNTPKSLLIHSK